MMVSVRLLTIALPRLDIELPGLSSSTTSVACA